MYDRLETSQDVFLLIEAQPFEQDMTGYSTNNADDEFYHKPASQPTFLGGDRHHYAQYWDDKVVAAAVIGKQNFCNSLGHEAGHLLGALRPSKKIYRHPDDSAAPDAAAAWSAFPNAGPRAGAPPCPP